MVGFVEKGRSLGEIDGIDFIVGLDSELVRRVTRALPAFPAGDDADPMKRLSVIVRALGCVLAAEIGRAAVFDREIDTTKVAQAFGRYLDRDCTRLVAALSAWDRTPGGACPEHLTKRTLNARFAA